MKKEDQAEVALVDSRNESYLREMLGTKWRANGAGDCRKHRGRWVTHKIADNRIQIVRAWKVSATMKSLIALEGIATPHQGLWQIESYEDHFAITTKEALTVGAFKWHDEIQEQIDTFGLELRPHSKGLKGYSHFDVLEEGCLRDAIERLYWLESCCWIINRMVAKSTQTAWNEAIEKALSKTPIPADPDEVVNPIGAIAFMQPRELWDNFA